MAKQAKQTKSYPVDNLTHADETNTQSTPAEPAFHADVPLHIQDMLMAMRAEEVTRRAHAPAGEGVNPNTVFANVPGAPEYNPVWNVLANYINDINDRVEKLVKPLEFEYEHGRPLMLVKMGSDARGWIPGVKHFDHVRRVLKAAGEDKRMNILLNHYALHVEFPAGHPDFPR